MKHNITYYILLAALVLTACSTDDDLTGQPVSDNSSIISFGLNSGGWQNGRPDTRAAQISDVGAPTTAQPNNIGVWGYYMTKGTYGDVGEPIPNDYRVMDKKEGVNTNEARYETLSNYLLPLTSTSTHTPNNKDKHYSEGTDNINTTDGSFPWEAQKYMFYCYAPHVDHIAGMNESDVSFGPTDDYKDFKLTNVPSISNTDIVIAKQRRPWYRLQNTSAPTVGYGSCVNFTDDGYRLQHIYAAVQFCFALNTKYADIRYLHIKDVQITTEEALASGDPKHVVTYNVTKDVRSYNGSITWDPEAQESTGANTVSVTPWKRQGDDKHFILGTSLAPFDDGLTPGKDYTKSPMVDKYYSYGCLYIAPQHNCEKLINGSGDVVDDTSSPKKFHMVVTYDVYDRKGLCTRQNAQASSDLQFLLKDVSLDPGFEAGKYYNAYIMINPDYLYVLSDKDNTADVVLKAGS